MTEVTPKPTTDEVVTNLLARLSQENFGTGALAELRRMDPSAPSPAAPTLHRLLAREVPEAWLGETGLRRWALLIHLLALASPIAQGNHPQLGETLFQAGYNEGRLTVLLEATESDFPVILPRLVRFLTAKGAAPHPWQLAALVLSGGHETHRLAIARSFYRAEAKA